MKFERKSKPGMPDVHAATITCYVKRYHGGHAYGADDGPRTRPVTVAVRAIRERSGKWRIDQAAAVAGTWAPWEPAGTSAEFNSLTAAKTALRSFARSCKQPK